MLTFQGILAFWPLESIEMLLATTTDWLPVALTWQVAPGVVLKIVLSMLSLRLAVRLFTVSVGFFGAALAGVLLAAGLGLGAGSGDVLPPWSWLPLPGPGEEEAKGLARGVVPGDLGKICRASRLMERIIKAKTRTAAMPAITTLEPVSLNLFLDFFAITILMLAYLLPI
jgi:hypothetical protein